MTESLRAEDACHGPASALENSHSQREEKSSDPQVTASCFPEQFVVKAFSELSRETLQNRWQAMNVLVRMNMLAGLKLELNAVLDLVCDFASEVATYDCALIFFKGEEKQRLELRLTRRMEVPSAENLRYADMLNAWVRECEGPLLISHGSDSRVDAVLDSVKAKSLLALPLFVGTQVAGCALLFSTSVNGFVEDDARLLWMLSLLAEKFFPRNHTGEALAGLAFTDFLTGLKSRRFFEEQLDREVKRAERSGNPLSVVLIDIDHFKQVNDTYGHKAGDIVLREVSSRLVQGMRDIDTVARYGGEEFVIILPDTNLVGADHLTERIRNDIEAAAFSVGPASKSVRLTISMGVASFPRDSRTKDGLVEAADFALYEAKRNGRNRIVHYSELDFKQGKRLEQRVCIVLPVRVWGMDVNGEMFEHEASTVDITTTGARLKGVGRPLHKGSIVGVQHKISKARYRVVWVGAQGSRAESQIGLRLIDSGKLIWGRVIPRVFGDDVGSGQAGVSLPNKSIKSEVLSISQGLFRKLMSEQDAEHEESDQALRYRCSGSVSFKQEGAAHPIYAAVSDIGLQGCTLELSPAMVIGTKISMLLNFDQETIKAQGEIRSSHPALGVQVRFSEMGTSDMTALLSLLSRLAGGNLDKQ